MIHTAPWLPTDWRGVFALTVFVSAALIFVVEPMVGRLVLPTLGGSPSVWNTSLAFFQVALLVGYTYAHLLQQIVSTRRQIIVHGLVLLAAASVLPLRLPHALSISAAPSPALWLFAILTFSVGAPFAALSATAPLVQVWYTRLHSGGEHGVNPYALYAASNLGSLGALLSYPLVIEPVFRLETQTLSWSLGYGLFLLLIALVGRAVWNAPEGRTQDASRAVQVGQSITWRERIIWVALSAAPASLMLGVTTYITTDIA